MFSYSTEKRQIVKQISFLKCIYAQMFNHPSLHKLHGKNQNNTELLNNHVSSPGYREFIQNKAQLRLAGINLGYKASLPQMRKICIDNPAYICTEEESYKIWLKHILKYRIDALCGLKPFPNFMRLIN